MRINAPSARNEKSHIKVKNQVHKKIRVGKHALQLEQGRSNIHIDDISLISVIACHCQCLPNVPDCSIDPGTEFRTCSIPEAALAAVLGRRQEVEA